MEGIYDCALACLFFRSLVPVLRRCGAQAVSVIALAMLPGYRVWADSCGELRPPPSTPNACQSPKVLLEWKVQEFTGSDASSPCAQWADWNWGNFSAGPYGYYVEDFGSGGQSVMCAGVVGYYQWGNSCASLTARALGNNPSGYVGENQVCGDPQYYFIEVERRYGENLGPQCLKVANPINAATGNKYQRESDYRGGGESLLGFERWYNNLDGRKTAYGVGWRNSFSRQLRVENYRPGYDPPNKARSVPSTSQAGACSMWSTIRDNNVELANTTAIFEGGVCKLKENGVDRGTIPVMPTNIASAPAQVPMARLAERDDGTTYRFAIQGGAYIAEPNITARLEAISGGFRYTDNDVTEIYDSSGKLLSITDRTGVQQVMGYDGQGHLHTVTDSFSRSLVLDYDADGRLQALTDPANQQTIYGYNANGVLASVSYPDHKTRRYHYEDARFPHALTGITDENNDRDATWSYDAQGRAVTSEHAGSVDHTSLVFGNGTTAVTDALNTTRTYSFEKAFGVYRLTGLTQPCGSCGSSSLAVGYDSNGYVNSRTDFNGNLTTYENDARGLEQSRTEAKDTPQERTITTTWRPDFRLPDEITEPGRKTKYTYDGSGNRQTMTVTDTATGEARTTTYTYTSLGLLHTVDGPRSDVSDITTYDYDASGNLRQVTNALNQITYLDDYDAHGNPGKITDPNGVETLLTYDPRQRLKTGTVAGALIQFDYDGVGNLKKVTLPTNAFLRYTYDAAHRLTDITDNQNNRIHYTLDSAGNRTKEEVFDPANSLKRVLSQEYDALGRLKKLLGANGQVTEYGYDDQGNRKTEKEANTFTTGTDFDALNRAFKVTDAANGVTEYGYDALDHLRSVKDPKNLTTSYDVNAFGEVTRQTSPDTGVTLYTYDPAGNRKTQTDARNVAVTYGYDALNRLTVIDYPGAAEDVTYTYDGVAPNGVGRLSMLVDASGTTTYRYNARGTLQSESHVMAGQTYLTQYAYDPGDNLTSVTYPDDRVINYARDSSQRVSQVTTVFDGVTTTLATNLQYLPYGSQTSATLGNGLAMTRAYDTDYRITGISAGSVQGLNYYYDPRNNIDAIEDYVNGSRSQNFDYDALSRLTAAQGSYGNLAYSYDAVGNRQSETRNGVASAYTYPTSSHRLSGITTGKSSIAFGYDAAGNTTGKDGQRFAFDFANRMTQVFGRKPVASYIVNAKGQRVQKSVGGTGTLYHYDQGGHLIAETDTDGNMQLAYVWLNDQLLAQVAYQRQGKRMTTTTSWHHLDHLGTPQLMTNSAGKVTWRGDYEPFGDVAVSVDKTKPVNNVRFPGQYFDQETGLNQNWFRDYDPSIGRYLESDPIGLWGGVNTYRYAADNPTGFIDPMGLDLVRVNLPGIGETYLDNAFYLAVKAFIERAANGGVSIVVNSAYRTPEKQDSVRMDPNAITPAKESLHSCGWAIDINYRHLGNIPGGLTRDQQQRIIREAAEAEGLSWGGRFRQPDWPHFYVDPGERHERIKHATDTYNNIKW